MKKLLIITIILIPSLIYFFIFLKQTKAQVCLPLTGYLVWPGTWEPGRIPMATTSQYILTASPLFVSGGNVGIDTTIPVYKLQVNGDISGTRLCIGSDCRNVWPGGGGGGGVAGTGIAGQIAFWTNTSTISGDNNLFWDNTNKRLGIGTTTPQTSLHVAGNITANTFLGTINAANVSSGQFGANTGGGNYYFMGNVGIGTTNPSEKLEINGGTIQNLETGGLLCKAYDDTNHVGAFTGRQIKQWKAGTIDFTDINPANQGDYFTIRCVGYIKPSYSETYTLYVTTDDGARVWINGKQIMNAWQDQSPTTYSGTINLTANTWYPIVIEHYENGGSERLLLEWQSTSQVRQTVPSSAIAFSAHEEASTFAGTSYFFGNVGIGTSTPSQKLDVAGGYIRSDTGFCIGTNCITTWSGGGGGVAGTGIAGQIAFWTNTSTISGDNNLFWDNTNKRLGIGTSTPQYPLHVNGNAFVKNLVIPFTSTSSGDVGVIYLGDTSLKLLHTYDKSGSASNIFIGKYAGNMTMGGPGYFDGTRNIGIGPYALTSNTTGFYNVAIGDSSLYSNTSGYYNISIGGALYYNTTGNYNVGIGSAALRENTTGSRNIAIGWSSAYANTTGGDNIAIGWRALAGNTIGGSNIAIGQESLVSANNVNQTIAIGENAMYYNIASTGTVAIGFEAARGPLAGTYSNEGGVYIGYKAGYSAATSSNYNVFVGYSAGFSVTTGQYNIVLGPWTSGGGITTGSNNILIGNGVMAGLNSTDSNQLNIGNLIFGTGLGSGSTLATGNVGIGTSTPSQKLDVVGGYIRSDTGFCIGANCITTWSAGKLPENITLVADQSNVTWSSQTSTLTEFLGATRHRTKYDLTNATQARLIVNVMTAGASSAELRIQYSTDGTTWNYLDGVSGPAVNINATGLAVSSWVNITSGAKSDVFLRIVGINGNGTASPAFGSIFLQVQ